MFKPESEYAKAAVSQSCVGDAFVVKAEATAQGCLGLRCITSDPVIDQRECDGARATGYEL